MRTVFGRRTPAGEWVVEVDYGSGWLVYGPPIRDRLMAATFARDLMAHGHAARVAPAAPQPVPAAAGRQKARPRPRRRRHGRPSR
jgi:hypothetical protein